MPPALPRGGEGGAPPIATQALTTMPHHRDAASVPTMRRSAPQQRPRRARRLRCARRNRVDRGLDDRLPRRRQRSQAAAFDAGTASASWAMCSWSSWATWTRRSAQRPDAVSASTKRRRRAATETALPRGGEGDGAVGTTQTLMTMMHGRDAASASTRRRRHWDGEGGGHDADGEAAGGGEDLAAFVPRMASAALASGLLIGANARGEMPVSGQFGAAATRQGGRTRAMGEVGTTPPVSLVSRLFYLLFIPMSWALLLVSLFLLSPLPSSRTPAELYKLTGLAYYIGGLFAAVAFGTVSRDVSARGTSVARFLCVVCFLVVPTAMFVWAHLEPNDMRTQQTYRFFPFLLFLFHTIACLQAFGDLGRMMAGGGFWKAVAVLTIIDFGALTALPYFCPQLRLHIVPELRDVRLADMYVIEVLSGSSLGALWALARGAGSVR